MVLSVQETRKQNSNWYIASSTLARQWSSLVRGNCTLSLRSIKDNLCQDAKVFCIDVMKYFERSKIMQHKAISATLICPHKQQYSVAFCMND